MTWNTNIHLEIEIVTKPSMFLHAHAHKIFSPFVRSRIHKHAICSNHTSNLTKTLFQKFILPFADINPFLRSGEYLQSCYERRSKVQDARVFQEMLKAWGKMGRQLGRSLLWSVEQQQQSSQFNVFYTLFCCCCLRFSFFRFRFTICFRSGEVGFGRLKMCGLTHAGLKNGAWRVKLRKLSRK